MESSSSPTGNIVSKPAATFSVVIKALLWTGSPEPIAVLIGVGVRARVLRLVAKGFVGVVAVVWVVVEVRDMSTVVDCGL